MSKSLIKRLKKSRQVQVKSGDFTFTCRRPTDLEFLELRQSGAIKQTDILRFVVDWGEVRELDLLPAGGTGEVIPFSREIFMEWIADHPEHWTAISEGILDAYRKHDEEINESLKNSEPGS